MQFKKLLVLALLMSAILLFSLNVYASSFWANGAEIEMVGQDGSNSTIVLLHNKWVSDTNPTGRTVFYMQEQNKNPMLATALTALSIEKNVTIEYTIAPNRIIKIRVLN